MSATLLRLVVTLCATQLCLSFAASPTRRWRSLASIAQGTTPEPPMTAIGSAVYMTEVRLPRQTDLLEYARLVAATVSSEDTLLRWYIARFDEDTAVVEAVCVRARPISSNTSKPSSTC